MIVWGICFHPPGGGFGQYLRNVVSYEHYPDKLSLDETEQFIIDLLQTLQKVGLVTVGNQSENGQVPGYQLSASAMVWKQGAGKKAFHDPFRV
jgi:hypothetical protein